MSTLKHILVVDDDDGTRETFRFYLRRLGGVSVSAAPTGHAALDTLRETPADLVLCDLRLPDMSGLDILRWLRSQALTIPFVIVTGFATSEAAVEAGRLGVTEFLNKPVDVDQLGPLVYTYLQEDQSNSNAEDGKGHLHALNAKRVLDRRHAESNLCLRAIAEAVGISETHLNRVFKRAFGMTVAEFLLDVRLREACRLMEQSESSMKAIAYQVGFGGPSQFTRAFRDRYGVPPTVYRARVNVRQRQAM
jgi:YesN/AraC family two-component response regulator